MDEEIVEICDGQQVERKGEETVPAGLGLEAVLDDGQLLLVAEFLDLLQFLGLLPDDFGFAVEFDEHGHFAAENFRNNRSDHVIDSAQGIAFGDVIFRLIDRGDENDRRVLGIGAFANHGRGLEAVHDGHRDVEQNHGKILLEQKAEGIFSGADGDDIFAEAGEDGFESEDFVRPVIDEEDVCLVFGGGLRERGGAAVAVDAGGSGRAGNQRAIGLHVGVSHG